MSVPGVNVLVLVKKRADGQPEERYVYLYDDSLPQRSEVCRVFGLQAADPGLSLDWHDAAVLANRVRKAAERLGLIPNKRNHEHEEK